MLDGGVVLFLRRLAIFRLLPLLVTRLVPVRVAFLLTIVATRGVVPGPALFRGLLLPFGSAVAIIAVPEVMRGKASKTSWTPSAELGPLSVERASPRPMMHSRGRSAEAEMVMMQSVTAKPAPPKAMRSEVVVVVMVVRHRKPTLRSAMEPASPTAVEAAEVRSARHMPPRSGASMVETMTRAMPRRAVARVRSTPVVTAVVMSVAMCGVEPMMPAAMAGMAMARSVISIAPFGAATSVVARHPLTWRSSLFPFRVTVARLGLLLRIVLCRFFLGSFLLRGVALCRFAFLLRMILVVGHGNFGLGIGLGGRLSRRFYCRLVVFGIVRLCAHERWRSCRDCDAREHREPNPTHLKPPLLKQQLALCQSRRARMPAFAPAINKKTRGSR